MAGFAEAPQPTQDPNWMFFSRPARENPRPNEAGNILAEGVGKDLETGSKLADSLQEKNVKDKVFDAEQSERSQFIGAANTLRNQQDAGQYDSKQTNILQPDTTAGAPTAVKNTIQQVKGVQNAYDNGKIDEKLYYQRVIPKLQAIRNQYPGYRDVVDQALGNNANAYMRTLVTELNERQSEAKEKQNKLETMGMEWGKAGYFGSHGAAVMQAIQNHQIDAPTLMKLAQPMINHRLDMEAQKDAGELDRIKHERAQWSDEDISKRAEADAIKNTGMVTYNNTVWPKAIATGMTVGSATSPKADMDAIDYAKLHLGSVDENQQMQHAANLQVYARQSEAEMDQYFNQPMPGDRLGRSYAAILGPTKVRAIKDAALAKINGYVESVGDPKTFATGTAIENIIKHQTSMDSYGVLKDKDAGPPIREGMAVAKLLGPEGTAAWGDFIMGGGQFAAAKLALSQIHLMGMFGQPDPNTPSTLGNAVKDGADAKIQDPAYYKNLYQSINLVTNKDVPPAVKFKGLTAFFAPTPENRAAISYFNKDTYDPATGRYINGADTMFQKITSPAVTKEVIKQKDPQLSKNYQDTADAWFHGLYSKEMVTLSQALQSAKEFKSRGVVTGKQPEIKLTWNNEKHEVDFPPEVQQYLKTTRQYGLLQSRDRLNMGLRNMGHIVETIQAEGYPADMNSYMIQLLETEGLQATPESRAAIDTIKAAIVATGKKQAAAQ